MCIGHIQCHCIEREKERERESESVGRWVVGYAATCM